MNEAADPKPARAAGAHRLANQFGRDPLAPGAARFPRQSVDGLPELVFKLDRRAVGGAQMAKGRYTAGKEGAGAWQY